MNSDGYIIIQYEKMKNDYLQLQETKQYVLYLQILLLL